MSHEQRADAMHVLAWAEATGATIVSVDDADGLDVAPEPPPDVDEALQSFDVRVCLACWLEDAAERWPGAWAIGSPMVRTWLAARSGARIAFTGAQHTAHDRHTARRCAEGHPLELADLLAVGDVVRTADQEPALPLVARLRTAA